MGRRLFTSSNRLGVRALVFFALCLICMLMDSKPLYLSPIRNVLDRTLSPWVFIIQWPVDVSKSVSMMLAEKKNLVEQNLALQAKNRLLKSQLSELSSSAEENKVLRALLNSPKQTQQPFLSAEIMAIQQLGAMRDMVMINRGEHSGVYRGQAVMDAYGVFGQVVHVAPNLAKVRLLTDPSIAVPAMIKRNGLRSVVQTVGQNLVFRYIPQTDDVQVGDVLLTSGLGHVFPKGYPIGEVIRIEQHPAESFMSIVLKPWARFKKSRHLLLPQSDKKGSL